MLHEMRLVGLAMDPFSNSPIVILKDKKPQSNEHSEKSESTPFANEMKPSHLLDEVDEDERVLPIWIGETEANAIATELLGIVPPRPMTHDLLRKSISSLGGRVERVIVTGLKDNTFFAVIEVISEDGEVFSLDSRPSDALALALRCQAKIFVDQSVIEQVQNSSESHESSSSQKDIKKIEPIEPDKWQDILDSISKDSVKKYEQ